MPVSWSISETLMGAIVLDRLGRVRRPAEVVLQLMNRAPRSIRARTDHSRSKTRRSHGGE